MVLPAVPTQLHPPGHAEVIRMSTSSRAPQAVHGRGAAPRQRRA